MNYVDIQAQSLAALKTFAQAHGIIPSGDRRLKSTWIAAIQEIAQETIDGAIATIQTIATYDNAAAAANVINAITRKSAKFAIRASWSILLVALALTILFIEAYQDRQRVMVKIRMGLSYRITRLKNRVRDRYQYLQMIGWLAFRVKLMQPALDKRDRVRLILSTAVN